MPNTEFLETLFAEGTVTMRGPPDERIGDPNVIARLQRAFDRAALDVAGPLLSFDAPTALSACRLLQHACWYLLTHDDPEETVCKNLAIPLKPTTAAHHFSADLLLRYLPQVHQRSRARDPSDVLTRTLALRLREWPLSGVLSSVEEEPLAPLEFDGHRGLLMLYAERFAHHERSSWLPAGLGREYHDLVSRRSGLLKSPTKNW